MDFTFHGLSLSVDMRLAVAVQFWTLDKAAELCQSHTVVTMYVNHTVQDLMKCYEMCPNIQPDTFVFDQQSAGKYRVQSSIFSSF